MMTDGQDQQPPGAGEAPARRGSGRLPRMRLWPWVISGLLFAFVLGLVGSPLFEREARKMLPPELQAEAARVPDPRIAGLAERVAQLESGAGAALAPGDAAALGPRLEALEARTATATASDGALAQRIELLTAELARARAEAIAGDNALRDLFLLSVARRMFEAGRPLNPIDAALASRLEGRDAAALAALRAWSQAPQTKRTLADRLVALEANPTGDDRAGWWDRFVARLSSLVTVRGRDDAKPVDREALLAEARVAMAEGDLARAVGLMERADWPAPTAQWLADARVLLAADEALLRLEADALETGAGIAMAAPAVPAEGAP